MLWIKQESKNCIIGEKIQFCDFDLSQIRLSESKRPEGYRLAKYSYNAFVDYKNSLIIGCGEDCESEDLAKEKAISELIERLCLKSFCTENQFKSTSNGWAAHPHLELAKFASVFELIERDAAVSHWLTKTPMYMVETSSILPNTFIRELSLSEFNELVCLVSFDFSGPLVTILLKNPEGYVISGHASGVSFKKCVQAATIEACRAAHHYLRFSFFDETKSILTNLNNFAVEPGAHSLMYAYHEPMPGWIFGKRLSYIKCQKMWDEKVLTFNNIMAASTFTIFKVADRFVTKAENPNLQSIFWGSTTQALKDNLINYSNKKNIKNYKPHLVG